jgi:predicted RNA-binding Zn ribbon-like protein
VKDLAFVGGCLCVDFVNTTGARGSRMQRERLETYADIVTWSQRAKLLSSAQARTLGAIAVAQPAAARKTLSRVRKIRERIYRLLRAVTDGRRPLEDDVAHLDALSRLERRRYQLSYRAARYHLRPRERELELDGMLWPIVASVVDLLTSSRLSKLARCGECDWLFVDDSKNRSRRWCKKECGDRVRARRHYAKRQA